MARNVLREVELYEPMRLWLYDYLHGKYRGCEITAVDSHARTLDVFLAEMELSNDYPQVIGLDIQIDVLGVVRDRHETKLVFIEAKKSQLTLHDLGQLWAYCRLCDPAEAFLLSSSGIGSLDKIVNGLGRVDLLDFGDSGRIKKMQVAKWDIGKSSVDFHTLTPKI